MAGFIARGLREKTYAVDIAADGEQGLYLASVNQYDLVILDVMLPRKDGYAVAANCARRASALPSSCSRPWTPWTTAWPDSIRAPTITSQAVRFQGTAGADARLAAASARSCCRGPSASSDLTVNTASHAVTPRRKAGEPHGERVCAAGIPGAEPRARSGARGDRGARVG